MSNGLDSLDSPEALARDIELIASIGSVPTLLRLICDMTGMGFAAVARVTDGTWTACAVQDNIGFGLGVGGQLSLETTLCRESRLAGDAIVIDEASLDPVYRNHHTPRIYGIESYVSVPIVRKDGSYFGNLCAIDPKPARVSDPKTLGTIKLFAELIAVQLQSEDRAVASESALIDARHAAELREHFIAVLGHDLRNPVAAVAGAAELLLRQQPVPDQTRIGKVLRASAKRMSGLIDDVLDFARGRLGSGIGISVTHVEDLATALRDVVEELRTANPGRVVQDSIEIFVPVACDRGRLQQLLSNLLGNALTHGDRDQAIEVSASIVNRWLSISVANGGDPMEPESLAKVFQPYWRPPTSEPGGGLGLGLYICSQIAKSHGGHMEVSSTRATGTRFTAHIPIDADQRMLLD